MQISVENTGELGRRLKVAVPADRIDGRVEQRIRELGRKVKLKGFRPGKVPFKVLQQRYGEQVRQDVVNDVLRESFQEAVGQEKLRPAATPEITAKGRGSGQDLEYTAEFEVYPQLDALDLSGLSIEQPTAEVSDQDVDNMIETLRRQRREWEQVERGAQEGDLVVIEYHAESGEARYPREGEERAGTVLGSNDLLPGLEEQLAGKQKANSETIELPLPADFPNQDLAGKQAQVSFKVLSVAAAQLPELNEEFIQSFGVASGGLGEFRGEVRNNLNRELQQAMLKNLRRQVVEGLLAAHADLKLPETLVEQEADNLRRQAQEAGEAEAKAAPASAYRDQARRRVAAGFLLSEAARQNQIQADPNRIRQKIAEIAATYEQPHEVIEAYQNNPQLLEGVQGMVLEEQVVEWTVQHATTVTEKPTSFDALMRPGAQAEVAA